MKKWLEGILSRIGTDKYYHFTVGFFLYLFLVLLVLEEVSLCIVFIIAFSGEIRDHYRKDSKFDSMDIVATMLPAILMYIIL